VVDASSLTRRRALALGAAAGLSSLIARSGTPAWAGRRTAPRGFALDVTFADRRSTGVVRAPQRFDLVGARGERLAGAGLEVRVRRDGGRWSPWVPMGAGHDHRPDTGTGAHASDPVWAGGADELELRCLRLPAGRRLRLQFVAVPPAAKKRGARAAVRARAAAKAHAAQGGPPAVIPRAQWGGDQVQPRSAPSYGDVQVAFVHHTVSANDYAPTDSPGIVLSMAKYHRDVNGWNDLGYNFIVDKYGQVFEGRAGGIDQPVVGAQAQGYNSHSTGIANIGTFESVPQTDAALDAMARLIAWKLPLHGAPVEGETVLISAGGDLNRYPDGTPVALNRICGHRDGDATACPGATLYAQLPELRRRTAAIAPAVPTTGVVQLGMQPPATEAVPYGDLLGLTGTLRSSDGVGLVDQTIIVQKRGASGWATVATAQTASDGTWQAAFPWKKAGAVRARAAVPGTAVAVTEAASVGLLPVVRAQSTTTRVRAGRAVAVRGTVLPVGNVRIDVERQVSPGRFKKVGSLTVKPRQSKFSARVMLRQPGLYRLTPRTPVRQARASASAIYVRAVRSGKSLQPAPSSSGGSAAGGVTAGA
jgi:hypothetical protein